MRSRQLYSSITATGQGTVYFDVPDNSTIRSVTFSVNPTSFTAGDYLELELSLSSANQTTTQDAQGVIASAAFQLTGAGSPTNVVLACGTITVPCGAGVRKGDRIYLNYTESGNSTWRTRALVWFD